MFPYELFDAGEDDADVHVAGAAGFDEEGGAEVGGALVEVEIWSVGSDYGAEAGEG